MYCRAPELHRPEWLRRLCESALNVGPKLLAQGRMEDALFCFKIGKRITWASGSWDEAAAKSMLAKWASRDHSSTGDETIVTSSICNGKVFRAGIGCTGVSGRRGGGTAGADSTGTACPVFSRAIFRCPALFLGCTSQGSPRSSVQPFICQARLSSRPSCSLV